MEDREKTLAEIVRRALVEDAARKDVTTRLLVDAARLGDAVIRAKAPGVVSGHEAAREVFSALDASIAYSPMAPDGSPVGSGAAVARVYGHVRAILAGERAALNFLQHLSGIATTTAAFVERVKGTGVVILDTRKTTPGLRVLEKMAVVHGGGQNHRANLAELILVKENHIAAAGGLASVLKKLGSGRLSQAEIEVTSMAELRMLREGIRRDQLTVHADRGSSMTPDQVRDGGVSAGRSGRDQDPLAAVHEHGQSVLGGTVQNLEVPAGLSGAVRFDRRCAGLPGALLRLVQQRASPLGHRAGDAGAAPQRGRPDPPGLGSGASGRRSWWRFKSSTRSALCAASRRPQNCREKCGLTSRIRT